MNIKLKNSEEVLLRILRDKFNELNRSKKDDPDEDKQFEEWLNYKGYIKEESSKKEEENELENYAYKNPVFSREEVLDIFSSFYFITFITFLAWIISTFIIVSYHISPCFFFIPLIGNILQIIVYKKYLKKFWSELENFETDKPF